MSSYRPKIKTNSDGTVSDLALDAETVKGHSVPTSGNASSNQIVLGNDTRLNATVTDVKMNGASVVSNSVANVNATPVSVMPANEGQIKTKFRTCLYGFSNYQNHYYKLCTLPATSDNNYASAVIGGRIGGWTANTMSYIRCIAWDRGGSGISVLDIGAAGDMNSIFSICDIEMYQNNNNSVSIYAHVNGFFNFDLDLEVFQDSATIDFDGSYTTTPEGTLVSKASTCSNRLEMEQGNLKVGGTPVVKTSDLGDQVTYSAINLCSDEWSYDETSKTFSSYSLVHVYELNNFITQNGTYVISIKFTQDIANNVAMEIYQNGSFKNATLKSDLNGTLSISLDFDTSNTYLIRIFATYQTGTTKSIKFYDCMVNSGNYIADYVPYGTLIITSK